MRSLASSLVVFFLLLLSQLVVWRIRKPAGHYTLLSILSLAVLIFSLGSFYGIQSMISGSARFLPVTALDFWNFVMLYAALTLSYMITYSAVQADSPIMTILLWIQQSGSEGLTREEMLAELNDQILVIPRLEDLVVGKLVMVRRGRYVIGPRGAFLAKIYISYRALLKMERGG